MKILVERQFTHEGTTYGEGETIDLPENIAKQAIDKGYAQKPPEKLGEPPELGEEPAETQGKKASEKSNKPLFSKRIPINSKKRNLKIVVWKNENNCSIALEEGKKKNEDDWENNRIYIPVAKSFETAERIREAGRLVRDREGSG